MAVTLCFAMAFSVYLLSVKTKAVYIKDGSETLLKFTTKQDAHDILSDEGIYTKAFDVVDASGFDEKVAYINIRRAFPVTIIADGITTSLMLTDGTVYDALIECNIKITSLDTVSMPLDTAVSPGDSITVTRVNKNETLEIEAIPHQVTYRETSLLKSGATRTLSRGYDGEKQITYSQTFTNGELTENKMVSEVITKQPKETIVLLGVAGKAISELDLGYTLNANGVPENYSSVLTNQVATGYSASGNPRGASGMGLTYGYVATNPNVIPYGTKMYIASADGNFVYGYAVAADTGIGLMQGVIDVDLFYDTYLESCLNGRKNVNIYILN